MPSPIVLQDPFQQSLGQGITGASNILAKALEQRQLKTSEQMKKQNMNTALNNALAQIPPEPTPMDILKFTQQAQAAGVPTEQIKPYLDIFAPGLKEGAKAKGAQNILQSVLGEQVTEQVDPIGNVPREPGAPPAQQPSLNSLTDDQLVMLKGTGNQVISGLVDAEMKKRELGQKRFEADRKYESGISNDYVKSLDEQRDSLRQKDQALYLMENALEEGNLSFFSPDNFANFLGQYGEGLRTAKGAQLINAQKEFLFGNLGRLKGRPNMFIEQQLLSQLPQIGRSEFANKTVIQGLKAEQDLLKAKQKVSDDLISYYRENLGYVPADIGSQVDKMLDPMAGEVQDRLSYNLRVIQEQEQGVDTLSKKKVSKGTPLTLEMANFYIEKFGSKEKARKQAEKLGYRIPTLEEYERYNQ